MPRLEWGQAVRRGVTFQEFTQVELGNEHAAHPAPTVNVNVNVHCVPEVT